MYAHHEYLSFIDSEWEAYVVEDQQQWQMVFPFKQSKKYGLKYYLQPKFTQFLGPVFATYSGKQSKELQWKKHLLTELTKQLKKDFHYVNFNCHPDLDYTLPFTWEKFRLTPKYTYQIALRDRSLDDIESEFQKGKIQHKKAVSAGIRFVESDSATELIAMFNSLKQGAIPHLKSEDYLAYGKAVEAAVEKGFCRIVEGRNDENELVGGMILYNYKGVCTYAFSVAHPKYSKLSIGHALIWKCIQDAHKEGMDVLDFEGSMIPEIERLFRRFGAVPIPYMNVQFAKWRLLYRS